MSFVLSPSVDWPVSTHDQSQTDRRVSDGTCRGLFLVFEPSTLRYDQACSRNCTHVIYLYKLCHGQASPGHPRSVINQSDACKSDRSRRGCKRTVNGISKYNGKIYLMYSRALPMLNGVLFDLLTLPSVSLCLPTSPSLPVFYLFLFPLLSVLCCHPKQRRRLNQWDSTSRCSLTMFIFYMYNFSTVFTFIFIVTVLWWT